MDNNQQHHQRIRYAQVKDLQRRLESMHPGASTITTNSTLRYLTGGTNARAAMNTARANVQLFQQEDYDAQTQHQIAVEQEQRFPQQLQNILQNQQHQLLLLQNNQALGIQNNNLQQVQPGLNILIQNYENMIQQTREMLVNIQRPLVQQPPIQQPPVQQVQAQHAQVPWMVNLRRNVLLGFLQGAAGIPDPVGTIDTSPLCIAFINGTDSVHNGVSIVQAEQQIQWLVQRTQYVRTGMEQLDQNQFISGNTVDAALGTFFQQRYNNFLFASPYQDQQDQQPPPSYRRYLEDVACHYFATSYEQHIVAMSHCNNIAHFFNGIDPMQQPRQLLDHNQITNLINALGNHNHQQQQQPLIQIIRDHFGIVRVDLLLTVWEQVLWESHQQRITQTLLHDPFNQVTVSFNRWTANLPSVHQRRQLVTSLINNNAQNIAANLGYHHNHVIRVIHIRAQNLFGHHRPR